MNENELSKIVLGEAIRVHKNFGPGLLESVYEFCLMHLLIKSGLQVERQKPIPLEFEGERLECGFRCDLIVENKLIIEIKSVDQLNEVHLCTGTNLFKTDPFKTGIADQL
jgi:GxxExxY protein